MTVKEVSANGSLVVFDKDYKAETVAAASVFPYDATNTAGVQDNTELTFLHDPSLLDNLRIRYAKVRGHLPNIYARKQSS